MLREAFGPEEDDETSCAVDARLDLKQLLLMAVATSIDALAVGVTFAFLEVKILPAISMIGITTFCLSLVGVAVGNSLEPAIKSVRRQPVESFGPAGDQDPAGASGGSIRRMNASPSESPTGWRFVFAQKQFAARWSPPNVRPPPFRILLRARRKPRSICSGAFG